MRTGAVELLLSQCPLNGGLCLGLLRRCWFVPRLLVHSLLIRRQQQITPRWIGKPSSVGSPRMPPRSMRPSRRSRSEEVPGLWVGHITWSFILCGSPPLVRQTEDRVRYPTLAGVRDSGARHFWGRISHIRNELFRLGIKDHHPRRARPERRQEV